LTLINESEEYEQGYQSIEMRNCGYRPNYRLEFVPVLPLGSLLEFEQLHRLDASVLALTGRVDTEMESTNDEDFDPETLKQEQNLRFVESLPESLEELTLRGCFGDIYAAIEILFERRRQGGLRKLEKVALYFQKNFSKEQISMSRDGLQYEMEGEHLGIRVSNHTAEFFHVSGE
jgi:hypothetical protein